MSTQPIQHIIFDLTGVLFRLSTLTQLRYIGLFQSIFYVITHRKNPVVRFLHVLKELHTLDPDGYPVIYYQNIPLPRCISDLMRGYINTQQAIRIIDDYIKKLSVKNYFDSAREMHLMQKIIRTLVQSNQTIIALKPNKNLIAFLKKLKNRGYTLYLLSNFDKESYDGLTKKYPDIFALFDNIVISSDIKMLKPYKEIYTYMLNTYHIEPSRSIFVDDQKENIDGAEKLGIKSIHYTGFKSLLAYFKKHNIE